MTKTYKSNILAVTAESAKRVISRGILNNGFVDMLSIYKGGDATIPFNSNDAWFAPRQHLESDENFRQVIPYILVEKSGKILVYERTQSGGESRLHNKTSVGFGGHVDIGDVSYDVSYDEDGDSVDMGATIANAALREITEELRVDDKIDNFFVYGVIMKDDDLVDKVHIGLVLILKIGMGSVLSNESQIDIIGFKEVDDILKYHGDTLEGWSKTILENIQQFGLPN